MFGLNHAERVAPRRLVTREWRARQVLRLRAFYGDLESDEAAADLGGTL